MISLDKCNETCNFAADLSSKVFFLSKTKDVNIKVPNIITNRNGAKTLIKHISYDCKCKFNSTTCNSYQKRNNKHINSSVESMYVQKIRSSFH